MNADHDSPEVGTFRYQNAEPATVPLNLAGLSFRQRAVAGRPLFGSSLFAAAQGVQASSPVGTVLTEEGPQLGVLQYPPALFTTGPLREYRVRRRKQDLVARCVLGVLALAVALPVGYLTFVHQGPHRGHLTPLTVTKPMSVRPVVHIAAPSPRHYTILPGDVLGMIAERHHIPLKALLAANHLTARSTLQIGGKLILPLSPAAIPVGAMLVPAPASKALARSVTSVTPQIKARGSAARGGQAAGLALARLTHYRVPAGQHDPALIAHRFGLSTNTLLAANRLRPGARVKPGRLLIVPPVDGYYHTVSRGDTIGKFLTRRHIDRATFERYNPGVTHLHLRQVVFLPGDPPVMRRHPELRGGFRPHHGRIRTHRGLFGDLGRALLTGFRWPLASHDITSPFGPRARDFHPGIDIAAPMGTPIHAAKSGVVVRAGWLGGYGKSIDIKDGGGIMTRYAHASSLLVHDGERIHVGQTIAKVGMTGDATGPHLHFEVHVGGRPVNPMQFFR